MSPRTRRRFAIVILTIALLAAAVVGADQLTERRAVTAEFDRLTAVAKLAASTYQRQVEKF